MAQRRRRPEDPATAENDLRNEAAVKKTNTKSANNRGRKSKRKERRDNDHAQLRLSMIMSAVVVAALMVIIMVRGYFLNEKLQQNNQRIADLNQEIEAQEQRTDDIEAYRAYTQTDEFVEEMARDKLGLVYDGETIFKKQDNQ